MFSINHVLTEQMKFRILLILRSYFYSTVTVRSYSKILTMRSQAASEHRLVSCQRNVSFEVTAQRMD